MSKIVSKDIEGLDQKRWHRLLLNSPKATFFHTLPWFLVWENSYPETSISFFVLEDQEGNYLAGFPFWIKKMFGLRKIFSLPFGTYGGFVRDGELGKDDFSFFAGRSVESLKKAKVIRIELVDFFGDFDFLHSFGFNSREYFTHILDLSRFDLDDPFRYFTRERKKAVTQSRKRGVEIVDIQTEEEVKRCYELTLSTYKRYRMKKPKYPFLLFKNIFNLKEKESLLKWVVAKREGKIIGSLVNFCFRDMVFAWEGASDFEYQSFRINDALRYHSIVWAKKRNFKIYNLGATPKGASGMLRYKESWGAKRKYYKIWEWESFLGKILENVRKLL